MTRTGKRNLAILTCLGFVLGILGFGIAAGQDGPPDTSEFPFHLFVPGGAADSAGGVIPTATPTIPSGSETPSGTETGTAGPTQTGTVTPTETGTPSATPTEPPDDESPSIAGVPPSPVLSGFPYNHSFVVDGSPAPTLSVTGGALPPGISLVGTALTGTPTTPGTYSGITVTAANGVLPNDSITFTIVVVAPFFANNDAGSVTEDTALIANGNVLANDTGGLSPAVLGVNTASGNVGGPVAGAYGTLTVQSNGAFTYQLDNSLPAVQALGVGEVLLDVFGYTAGDSLSISSAHLTITINGNNDPPVAVDDGAQISEAASPNTVGGNVLTNDTDLDGDTLVVSAVEGVGASVGASVAGTYGSVVIGANGAFTYTLDQSNPAVQALAPGDMLFDPFTYTASDGQGGVDDAVLTITIIGVNDPPTFDLPADPDRVWPEDFGGFGVVGFATNISPGPPDEAGQGLTFIVTNDNNALFSVQPAINELTGGLTFTGAADAFGLANVTVVLMDDGGTAGGGDDTSDPQFFTITITPVNDEPSFDLPALPDQAVDEDAGPQTVVGFATNISAGPANESAQVLTFDVSTNNDALFSALPAIDPLTGTLTYTAAANTSGTATVSVFLMDDGGTAGGGDDTSPTQMFDIVVAPVNDVPSFSIGGDQTVLEDAGPQTVLDFATGISAGAPDEEAGQVLTFTVTNDNNSLFLVQPDINELTGDLTYTPAADANGSALVSVFLMDDGGGTDTSATQQFTINVTAVNDVPSFTLGGDVPALPTDGPTTVPAFATNILAGPPDEQATQVLTFIVTNDDNTAFTVQPDIDPVTGDLTFDPAPTAGGSVEVTVVLMDDGGIANGGVDTSAAQTFNITFNEPPVVDLNGALAGFDVAVTFVEQTPELIAPAGTVTDPEGDNITSLTAVLTSRPDGDLVESLSLTVPDGGLTVGYVPATGTFTVTGSATPAAYEAILQGIAYDNTSDDPDTTSRTVTVVVTDATSTSIQRTSTITITPVDDPPTAVDDSATVLEDSGANTIDVLANDTDPEGDAITVTGVDALSVQGGAVLITNAGADLTYEPAADYCNSPPGTTLDTFTYTVNGGDTATVTVTVNCVNDAPSFTGGPDQNNVPNQVSGGGANAVTGTPDPWATNILAGPADEAGQVLTFLVSITSDPNDIFTGDPAISATGVLTFTTNPATTGTADISVVLMDDGGVANGGVDTSSPPYTFTITTVLPPPVAVDDPSGPDQTVADYTATGGVPIDVPASVGVLVNDELFGTTVIAGYGDTGAENTALGTPFELVSGGFVTLNANGSFRYEPPCVAPASGTDVFRYRLNNSTDDSNIATVTIVIEDQACFVQNNALAGGNGSVLHPFQQLPDVPALRATGGVVYVRTETVADAYNAATGITLKDGEWLVGQGVSFAGNLPFTLATRSDLAVLPAAGTAPRLHAGTGDVVTLGLDNTLRGFSAGNTNGFAAIGDQAGGFGTLDVNNTVAINTTHQALRLSNGGTFATGSAFSGVTVSNAPAATAPNKVNFTNVNGDVNLGTGTINGVSGSAIGHTFLISGGDVDITYAGSISHTTALWGLLSVAGGHTGTVAFSGSLSATEGTGLQFSNADGTYNFNGTTTLNGGDAGIDILAGSGGTFAFGGTTITNPSGTAFFADASTPTVTSAGAISQNAGKRGIFLQNNTGGSFVFTGVLTLNTTTQPAFEATAAALAGSVRATAATNVLSTTTATALRVNNVNIGGANPGLVFQSINSNGGAASGIILNNTGAAAGLTVSGTGGANSGGTIQAKTGVAIMLTSTRDISFTNIFVNCSAAADDDGIRGSSVTNFALANSTVANCGDAVTERGIEFTNLLGTASITGSTVTGSAEDNLFVVNNTGTLTLTVSTSTFSETSATVGNDGIHFLGNGTANMSIGVTNSTFANHRGDHFQAATDAASAAVMDVVFQNNDLSNSEGNVNLGSSITLNIGGTALLTFDISNNGTALDPYTGAISSAITINSSNDSTMSGRINNNFIGAAADVDSGSFTGDGINVTANGTSDITVAITNNTIRQYSNLSGISVHVRDNFGAPSNGSIHATITGNTIANPGTFASHGILAQAGAVTGDNHFLCVDIGGAGALANSIAGSGANGSTDFRVRQRFLTTVRLPGYGGANNDDAAVVSFIQGRNNLAETGSATNNVVGGGGGFVGGAACNQPAP